MLKLIELSESHHVDVLIHGTAAVYGMLLFDLIFSQLAECDCYTEMPKSCTEQLCLFFFCSTSPLLHYLFSGFAAPVAGEDAPEWQEPLRGGYLWFGVVSPPCGCYAEMHQWLVTTSMCVGGSSLLRKKVQAYLKGDVYGAVLLLP